MLRTWFVLPLCLIAIPAFAKGIDVAADTITHDPYGAVIAEGDVVIHRKDETLKADQIIYDASKQQFKANGNVAIESSNSTIRAESALMHTADNSGELHKVQATLKGGERLAAGAVRRQADSVIIAADASFTACPPDAEAWILKASEATLNQNEGLLTAKNATFEMAGIPVLYMPYWRQVLRRKSGFLTPFVSTGHIRGTEWALPYYIAPAENWDATLTPHWMTARGFMGELEFRHIAQSGHTALQVEGLRDKKKSRQRSRLRADINQTLPFDITFSATADHVSDRYYLADFSRDSKEISKRYLQSAASLSQGFELGEWSLLVRHQQDLIRPTNAATLQILPRFEGGLHLPLLDDAVTLHINQQSTQFTRTQGVDGWRVDINPYLEIPWHLAGGGIQSTLQIGGRHTRYWLKDTPGQTILSRNTFEASLDNRILFERISEDSNWRHTITPILRYDFISAPDQSALPNFDSAFGKLSMSNLLTGNRFTGKDRIERLNRISALLGTGLQHKGKTDKPAHTYIEASIGAAYELRRQSIDPAQLAAPTHPFSNLLGDIAIHPTRNIHITASGQYDPAQSYWPTARAGLNMASQSGHAMKLSWQRTDARYATASELVTADATVRLAQRWKLYGRWEYDLMLRLTQQASGGIHYLHPCWDMNIEGYRNRLNSSTAISDFGFRFLLGFKGLGSVGS